MSEELRFIVERLNKDPYNKSFTIISFDSLDPLNLLQVLNDVVAEIDPDQRIDLREEAPDQTALRLLSTLRIFNYKPKADAGEGMNAFRQGLVQGEKLTVYPLIKWLLERTKELKKRTYLARFLVKIEVPMEHLQDEVVEETYQTYQNMVDHFKELHKAVENERSSEYNTGDVRSDIESMEEEKRQLQKQLERLKRRVETFPQHQDMLESAQKLRKEKERRKKLKEQREEQKSLLAMVQQKRERLARDLEEVKNSTADLTADKVITKAEEEGKLQKILAREDLPKKIEGKRNECIELERVLSEEVVSDLDLEVIQQRIEEVNEEIRELAEKKMVEDESGRENLSMFRQQASMIGHKRKMAAETVQGLMEELSGAEKELEDRRNHLEELGGMKLVREEEFKKYIEQLRSMSNTYKRKKAELSVLRAEFGVLSRTEEVLKSRDENALELLEWAEKRKGVAGHRGTRETLEKVSKVKSELDERKEQSLQAMSHTVEQLKAIIEEKKTVLAPLIREVRPLRQKHQEIKAAHSNRKSTYDSMAAGYQANRSQLDREVRSLWQDCIEEERQFHYLNCLLESVRLHDQRVKVEMKAMVSKDPAEKKKCLRDQLTRKIHEQENLGRALRDKQKDIKETHEFALGQVKMWKDLERLFQAKKDCFRLQEERSLREKELNELNTTVTDGCIQIMS